MKRALVILLLVAGCATFSSGAPSDTAYIQILRLRITKVRHAIDETRETIAQSSGAPYLPELYVRLAELLSEEAKYHYRVAYEREQRATESLHVPQVRALKDQAIGVYKKVLRDWPGAPIRDRVLFNMAQEHRELGNFEDMKATFEQLVREHPQSPLKQHALLILGDYYFDKNELEPSGAYYKQIVDGGPSDVEALAHYKLAWVEVNLGECEAAIREFEKALEADKSVADKGRGAQKESKEAPQSAAAESSSEEIDVKRAALVDLVYCYSQERKSKAAVSYLREHAYDRATFTNALEKLARRYGVMDEAGGSLAVVRQLLRIAPAERDLLDDARQLHAAVRATKTFDEVGADVRLMLDVLERHLSRVETSADLRKKLTDEFEVYARDLLTRAQDRLPRRDAKDLPRVAADLADGYRAYLATFTDAKLRIDMMLNAGDVSAQAGRDYEAGVLAYRASERIEDPARKRDTLYDAVVRFQAALAAENISQSVADRQVARGALRRAGTALLRYPLDATKTRVIKFAIAQSYYDEGLHLDAIHHLTAVAYEYPNTTEATAAVRLVLDSYNTLNDFTGLIAAGRRFAAAGSPVKELAGEIKTIIAAAEQRTLDEVSLEAAGEDGEGMNTLLAFAHENEGSALGERALLNAFVAARAVGDTAQLYKLGDEISRKYPQSDQIHGLLSTLAQMAVARFEVDRSVDFLERALQSGADQRPRLLVASGELYESLGQPEKAEQAYLQAAKEAGARGKSEPVAHLVKLVERTHTPTELLSILKPFASEGDPEVMVRIGLAQVALKDNANAETTLQGVLNSGSSASPEVLARAHYGMAEILRASLSQYPTLDKPEVVEEYVTVVDVVQQSYVNAVRQGDPDFAAAALGRTGSLVKEVAERLKRVPAPTGLPADVQKSVTDAIAARIEQLNATAEQAKEVCSQQAWSAHSFGPPVRACLKREFPETSEVKFDLVKPRAARPPDSSTRLEALRARLARDPEDTGALRALGEDFLQSGDPHAARMVFAAAAEKGGGPIETNLLGVADYQVGDITGALDAFTRAAEGGIDAGRQNLVTVLREQGLEDLANQALKKFEKGREGGRLLGGPTK